MKNLRFLLVIILALTCFSISSAKAYIINTGAGLDSLDGGIGVQLAGSPGGVGYAGEFSITQPVTITSIEWWMAVYTSGVVSVTIREDAGDLPGSIIKSQTFTAPLSIIIEDGNNTYPPWGIWSGPMDLNWNLNPGTYWVGLELYPGSSYTALLLNPSPNPLANEAISTNITDSGYNISNDSMNLGVRIGGSAVPIPGTILLLGSGLLGLAGWRRFRKS